MDELDVKILRSLISEGAVAPSNPQVKLSLRAIAERIGTDKMTVSNRYKKLQDSGCMSAWSLLVNPTFFGYMVEGVMLDVQTQSGKSDMINKLRLVHEITGLVDFYGCGLRLFVIYNGDVSRSRSIELISRITNAEKITQTRMALPKSETKHLTATDIEIIRALSNDARRLTSVVAKELGLSTKTVRNRVEKLGNENTIFPFPILNIECVPGLIPIFLSYLYTNNEVKESVDRAVISHFDASYITGSFSDAEMGELVLGASSMAEVNKFSAWIKSQPGIASLRVDIPTMTLMFPEKLIELAALRDEKEVFSKNHLALSGHARKLGVPSLRDCWR